MKAHVVSVLLGALTIGLSGCGDECELLAAESNAEVQVTNDLDSTFEVTVRAVQGIYALGTDLGAGDCARWPVSAAEFSVEMSGSCQGESESFEVADGETRQVNLSSIPCD